MDKFLQDKMAKEEFDKMASHYEEGLWGKYFRYCYKKVRKITEPYIKADDKILDLGCGTGGLAFNLASMINENGEIVGVDISPKMIEVANNFLKSDTHCKNIKFVIGEAEKLSFSDGYFNLVFCLNSFHHYFNQRTAINEIFRTIRPGGYFILLDAFLDNPIRKIWGVLLKHMFGEPYAKFHIKKSLRELFSNSNAKLLAQKPFLYLALISIYQKK